MTLSSKCSVGSSWRGHSCLPRRDSSRRWFPTRLDTSVEAADKSVCATILALVIFAGIPIYAVTVPECDTLRRHGQVSEARVCFQTLTLETQTGLRAEGFWGLRDLQSANNEFRKAIAANPKDPMLRVRWGRLMIEGNNKEEAAKLFEEAMEIQEDFPPALLGIAIEIGRAHV